MDKHSLVISSERTDQSNVKVFKSFSINMKNRRGFHKRTRSRKIEIKVVGREDQENGAEMRQVDVFCSFFFSMEFKFILEKKLQFDRKAR